MSTQYNCAGRFRRLLHAASLSRRRRASVCACCAAGQPMRPAYRAASTTPSALSARSDSVLIVGFGNSDRAALRLAFESVGVPARAAASIADVDRWPEGQVVVTDPAHATPIWRTVGAAEVIVIGQTAGGDLSPSKATQEAQWRSGSVGAMLAWLARVPVRRGGDSG